MRLNIFSKLRSRKVANYSLLAVIILCNGYLIYGFFGPAVEPAVTKIISPVNELPADQPATSKPNSLIIPKLQLDTPIKTENSVASLNNAVWMRPSSVEPGQNGNTVLAGHRFSYLVDPVFYNLDRMAAGDRVQVVWNETVYNYEVREVNITSPNAVQIESQNFGERLTLYTCTPLWSTAQRLVVIAERV